MTPERKIVHRIEDGMDRREVACTTYQQRNFYTQFRDGYFRRNDSFNYLLHHHVANQLVRPGDDVLDVCCGRGLMLPLLRYYAQPRTYTGLDIRPENATWQERRVTDGKPYSELVGVTGRADYYPFETRFVEGNVAQADQLLDQPYTFIIYTASIEHMHPDDGRASLHALRRVAAPQAEMVLTCPNTPPDQDGYDTRYRAHVYEWKLSELTEAVQEAGWEVTDTWGCDAVLRDMEAAMREWGWGEMWHRLRQHVPQEWLVPALAPLFPEVSSEVALLCRAGGQGALL